MQRQRLWLHIMRLNLLGATGPAAWATFLAYQHDWSTLRLDVVARRGRQIVSCRIKLYARRKVVLHSGDDAGAQVLICAMSVNGEAPNASIDLGQQKRSCDDCADTDPA